MVRKTPPRAAKKPIDYNITQLSRAAERRNPAETTPTERRPARKASEKETKKPGARGTRPKRRATAKRPNIKKIRGGRVDKDKKKDNKEGGSYSVEIPSAETDIPSPEMTMAWSRSTSFAMAQHAKNKASKARQTNKGAEKKKVEKEEEKKEE